ncbi:hypothetical protein SteCoe_14832 [Stentor coeruleus]|uniref:Uncharacterized protein n=1 Tax=Stentor coeruleus TaxID=5963 RepID=A0A1R2C586_9CILI|nr:hypothetical protein SteCoe_14832 [Stentor coeruleus]
MVSQSPRCAIYCLIISVFGTIFLSVLAIVLVSGYEYIKVDNQSRGGEACFWSAVIYMGISILCFIYLKRRRRRAPGHPTFSSYEAE